MSTLSPVSQLQGAGLGSVQQPGTEAGPEQLEGAAVEQTGAEAEQEAKSQDEPAIEAAEATPTEEV